MPALHTLEMRPPWRDELSRLRSFFRRPALAPGAWKIRVLVSTEPGPERIVGAFACLGAEGRGQVRCALRGRYETAAEVAERFGQFISEMEAEGIRELAAETIEGSPEERLFAETGFTVARTEEWWEIDLETVQRRLDRIVPRLRIPVEWVVRRPQVTDAAEAARIVAPYGLLNAERIASAVRQEAEADAYDLELSTVVVVGEQLAGLLMVKPGPKGLPYVEIRAVDPAHTAHSSAINSLLIQATNRAMQDQGFTRALLTVNPERDRETRNFVQRGNGQIIQVIRGWHRKR